MASPNQTEVTSSNQPVNKTRRGMRQSIQQTLTVCRTESLTGPAKRGKA